MTLVEGFASVKLVPSRSLSSNKLLRSSPISESATPLAPKASRMHEIKLGLTDAEIEFELGLE